MHKLVISNKPNWNCCAKCSHGIQQWARYLILPAESCFCIGGKMRICRHAPLGRSVVASRINFKPTVSYSTNSLLVHICKPPFRVMAESHPPWVFLQPYSISSTGCHHFQFCFSEIFMFLNPVFRPVFYRDYCVMSKIIWTTCTPSFDYFQNVLEISQNYCKFRCLCWEYRFVLTLRFLIWKYSKDCSLDHIKQNEKRNGKSNLNCK